MSSGFLKSKLFLWMGLSALIVMGIFLAEALQRKYLVRQEIRQLEEEIVELESRNQEILKLIKYFKTAEYRQRQARSLLNLQKPGEFVVALPPGQEEAPSPTAAAQEHKSNFQKWWEYFFQ